MRPSKALSAYVPVAASISALLHPHGEVVLHDLASGKIAGISTTFTLSGCNERTCSATIPATPDQIKNSSGTATLSP